MAEADGRPSLGGAALFGLLKDRCMLVSRQESARARARLRPLQNLFDRDSLGSFHQRVGQYLVLEMRVRAHWREWHGQKFSHYGSALLDNAYRLMQEPCFDGYFTKERLEGWRVLYFGCGNGYYTAKFAARGAQVLGLGNTAELLEIARANHGAAPNLELALTRSFEEVLDLMAAKVAGSFDLVYPQDTLPPLVQPEFSEASPLLPALFAGFHRLLWAGGSFCAMEPNPSCWLAGRYCDPAQPYAVVTEYRNPVFNVAPTLHRLLPVMAQAGFALKDLRHPSPPPALAYSGPAGGTAAQGGHA
ncbi:MAG: class I SAM-dependent methyltransferase [Burkholderiaceae bacterium]